MSNELYHYGVKGMKWGIRRTPRQLGHRTSGSKTTADQQKKAEMKDAVKNRRLLSDVDLRRRIERVKLEKQLKELTESEIAPGKSFCKQVLSSSGRKVATTVTTGAALYLGKAAMTGRFDIKEMASYMTPKPKK